MISSRPSLLLVSRRALGHADFQALFRFQYRTHVNVLDEIGYAKSNNVLPGAQSQAASFTATHSVKKMVYRCLYYLVPDADKRERDGVRRAGEAISLHTRLYSQSLQIPKCYRYSIVILPRVPRLVPGTVYNNLQGYSTCPSHVIVFCNTPSGNPTIPRRMILRDHRCSYFVR